MASTDQTPDGPTEQLPFPVPSFIIFFLPNLWGAIFAYIFEYFELEILLAANLPSHPFALLGIGVFALAHVSSYLSGCVACARLDYNVKLPNLYANKADNKHAVLFNCIQRGHQNFLESFPQVVRRYLAHILQYEFSCNAVDSAAKI